MYKSILLSLVLLCGCESKPEVFSPAGTVTDVQTLYTATKYDTHTITVIKTTNGNFAVHGVANVANGEEVQASSNYVRVGGYDYYRK